MGIQFDWSVSLGTILQIGSTVVVVVAFWSGFKTRIELTLKNQDSLMTNLAKQHADHQHDDERKFSEISARITDLVGGVQRLIGQNERFRQDQRQS